MALELIIFVVAVIVATLLTALSNRYRRFDAVSEPENSVMPFARRNRARMIPRDQQVTENAIRQATTYDAADDLLDPSNPHHEEWLEQRRPQQDGGASDSD